MRSTSLVALALVSACGSASSTPRASTVDADLARAQADALSQLRGSFPALFGEHAALYAGALEAHRDVGELDEDGDHDVHGRVAGWVEPGFVEGEVVLTLLEVDGEAMVEVWQQHDTPGASGFAVGDAWEWGGHATPWDASCAPALDARPASLTLDCTSRSDGEGAHEQATGSLQRVDWPALGADGLFACMQRLNGAGEHEPRREGDRVLLPVHGGLDAGPVVNAPADHPECTRTRSYTGTVQLEPSTGTMRVDIASLDEARTVCCTIAGARAACTQGPPSECITLPDETTQ